MSDLPVPALLLLIAAATVIWISMAAICLAILHGAEVLRHDRTARRGNLPASWSRPSGRRHGR